MEAMAFQITSLFIIYSTVNSGADQRKHQSPASLAFVRGVHRWPVDTHKWPVTRKMFPFDDVIIICGMNDTNLFASYLRDLHKVVDIFKRIHWGLWLSPRARPPIGLSIEFEIQWNFPILLFITYSANHDEILHVSR